MEIKITKTLSNKSGVHFSQANLIEKKVNTYKNSFVKSSLIAVQLIMFCVFWDVLFAQTITSFSPESGSVGSTVVISGNGFNTVTSNNVVFFGAVKALVTEATSTSLTVVVPAGTTFHNISVTNLTNNLTAYSSRPFIVTFPGSTTLKFASKIDFGTGVNPFTVSIGDLNGDGKSDLAVANTASSTVSVLRNISNTPTVSFAAKVDFATGSHPYTVIIRDIDGDGKPDMTVDNYSSSTVSVFRNTSVSGLITFAPKVDFATGINPHSVSVCDFNSDGKPDIVSANWVGNSVSVFRNTSTSGNISFAQKVDFLTATTSVFVNTGDLDGDGKPDIVTANWYGNNVSLFRNTSTSGNISFAPRTDLSPFDLPDCVGIGDLNGDGKPELVVSCRGTDNVSTLRNTSVPGAISFAMPVDFATGYHPFYVSLGDLDGDGKPDLSTANFGLSDVTGSLSVMRNMSGTGPLSFNSKIDFTTGDGSASVCVGDLDGDGKPDVVVANNFSYTVSVFRNTANSIVNIKVIPEGFYDSATDKLRIKDTVRAYLHSTVSPFNLIDSSIALIDSVTFNGKFYFTNAPNGTYYIKIIHRNALETWSRSGGVSFTAGATMNYDFTTSGSQAFGNNQIQVNNAPLRFAIYSGDVSHNRAINLEDVIQIDNDVSNFATGYIVTDLTGNYFADLTDMLIAYNNSSAFVSVIKP